MYKIAYITGVVTIIIGLILLGIITIFIAIHAINSGFEVGMTFISVLLTLVTMCIWYVAVQDASRKYKAWKQRKLQTKYL